MGFAMEAYKPDNWRGGRLVDFNDVYLSPSWVDLVLLQRRYTWKMDIPLLATADDRQRRILKKWQVGIDQTGGCTRSPMPGYIFNANYTPAGCGSPNADTFACAMRGIAAAMTKTVRNAGVIANGTDIGDDFLVRGRAITPATFIRVQWYWIALPCTVWILGLLAWVVVAFQTSRMRLPTWRDDSLPLVFLYREGDDHQGSGRVVRPWLHDAFLAADDYSSWAYEKVAEGMNVQLLEVPSQPEPGGGGRTMRLVRTEEG